MLLSLILSRPMFFWIALMRLTCLSLGAHPLLWYSLEGDPFVLGTDFFSMCFLLLSASMGILETLILPFLILESGW